MNERIQNEGRQSERQMRIKINSFTFSGVRRFTQTGEGESRFVLMDFRILNVIGLFSESMTGIPPRRLSLISATAQVFHHVVVITFPTIEGKL